MIFYDFEVFKYDWLVVAIDMQNKKEHVIVNDPDQLRKLYEENVKNIWIGFNSKHYDQFILKGIMLGMNPKNINDDIILRGKKGYEISPEFKKIPFCNYDIMLRGDPSLKTLEGYMGNDIQESSVDFNIDRKLTQREIQEVIEYCRHDVQQTINVFLHRQSEFTSHLSLSSAANGGKLNLSYLNKTKTQLSAMMLEARQKFFDDEFDLIIPKNLKISKYKGCIDWYRDPINHCYKKKVVGKSGKLVTRDNQLDIMIAGVPHVLGYGGIHGAIKQYHGVGNYILMDVTSLYPTLMIEYNLLSRSVKKPEKFEQIYRKNLDLKAAGKKAERAPYKLTCNSTYGAMKDKYNQLFDPRMANNVCVHGQLFLVDLIEQLEPYCEIIQSNTDGILIKYEPDNLPTINFKRADWEQRTGLRLEFDYFNEVYQKDVNNYVFIGEDGIKTKGGFVKRLNELDNDLPIVNKAVNDYLTKKIPIEETIYNCNKLKDFQMVKRITSKFDHLKHGDKILQERCVRVFASKNKTGGLYQLNKKSGRYGKVTNTPENCFIYNADVNDVIVPDHLDRDFYIDLARHRLKLFGVSV